MTAAVDPQTETPTGAIAGMVRFTGQAPPPQRIVTTDGSVLMHSDLVVDAKSQGLRDVVVYLVDAQARPLPKNAKPVIIDQRDMVFLPRVVVAQAGQTVRFDNSDQFNHAVQSITTTTANLFNVVTPTGQHFEFKFNAQRSPVQIGCPIHGWMRAWVYVLPHSFAAVTDAQGRFKIDGVPAGKYTLQFAHPDTGLRDTRQVEVTAGKTATVDLEWSKTSR